MLTSRRTSTARAALAVLTLLASSVFSILAPAAPVLAQRPTLISEIRIDQPSTDNDEYFEISGDPGASLNDLTYLVIGDGTGAVGCRSKPWLT